MIGTTVWILGWIVTGLACSMVMPALVSFGFGETDVGLSFILSAGLVLFAGIASVIAVRGSGGQLDTRSAIVLTALTWPITALFAAIPFYFSGVIPNFTGAYFEAVSGVTGSGASVLIDVSSSPKGIIMWRALLQWLGGFATILLALSFLSLAGVGGMNLFRSWMPRGERDTVAHRFWQTVQSLGWVYVVLTLICGAALGAAGMGTFDAAAHAFSTISTGGFSSRTGGIAEYSSGAIEAVLIVFMLLGAVNSTLFWALANGRWREMFMDVENRYIFALILIAVIVAIVSLTLADEGTFGAAIRLSIFNVVSALTTTGFSASSNELNASLPVIFPVMLTALMLIGGASASTSGGVKQLRIIVFFKLAARELFKLSHPHGVTAIKYSGKSIDESSLRSTWGFLMTFLTFMVVITLAFGLSGLDLRSNLALAAASLSNTGAGLGMIAPGLQPAELPMSVQWVVIGGQLIGRVELLIVIIFFSPTFWRN